MMREGERTGKGGEGGGKGFVDRLQVTEGR